MAFLQTKKNNPKIHKNSEIAKGILEKKKKERTKLEVSHILVLKYITKLSN